MNRKNKILLLLLAFLSIVSFIYYKVSNPYKIDIETIATEKMVSANELVASFNTNEKLANTTFKGKIIEVNGIVKEITFLNNRNTVLLHGNIPSSSVLCDMQQDQLKAVKRLTIGEQVKLKGICKGFLKDAILLNCMLINKPTDE